MPDWPLSDEETLIWEGRPRPTPWTGREALGLAVGAGILGLGAMSLAVILGGGVGWMAHLTGIVAFLIGLASGALALWVIRARDRQTFYALTDRRVLLSRPGRGWRTARRPDGWAIADFDAPRLRRHGDGSVSLVFPGRTAPTLVAFRRVPPGQRLHRALATSAPA
ncbi:MAG: hypothetical protein AAF919_13670 [Pseudomonadota bacterium]